MLLCLPGWCIRPELFYDLLPLLSRRTRAMAIEWQSVEDVLAAVEASGAQSIVPVAQAHAGWIAIELRRRLGARVPGIVLTSWAVGEQPPPLRNALVALRDPERWEATRDQLISMWSSGAPEELAARIESVVVKEGFETWSRAGEEIASAYAREKSPLDALSSLGVPVLHVYSQPRAPEFLAAQEQFSRDHPWFRVRRLDGTTHFPMLELPDALAKEIVRFIDEGVTPTSSLNSFDM